LFCCTQGRSNEYMSTIISLFNPYEAPESCELWEKRFTKQEVLEISKKLKEDGAVVLEDRLPERVIQDFLAYTAKTPARLRPLDYQIKNASSHIRTEVFHPDRLNAVRYEYEMMDLAKQPFIQEILAQSFFQTISGTYLQTTPVLDIIQCWWHTSFGGVPDENAAQKYHFDMDRLKWLKIFIYLNDVEADNGPHCFVRGSHKPGSIPWSILSKGYRRIDDSEVMKFYAKKDEWQFHGKAGTIILEDTRGLHKGLHVHGQSRLMFELQFANSLFGAPLVIDPSKRIELDSFRALKSKSIYEYIYKVK
jgi:ectoine hydroxylase-related dioxygenase (phytanoyl-CoA dioxygenase family)